MTKEQKDFLKAYKNKACNISVACKAVNISRQTFYDWKKKSEEFAKKVDEIYEELVDFAESNLFKLIQGIEVTEVENHESEKLVKDFENGGVKKLTLKHKKTKYITGKPDTASVIFFLKTKGKSRGWIEKQIVENTNFNHDASQESLERVKKLTSEERRKLIELNRKIYD